MHIKNTGTVLRTKFISPGNAVFILVAIFLLIIHSMLMSRNTIYWGALVKGTTYDRTDAPWDMQTLALFEQHAQKQPSILHWGQAWWACHARCEYQPFDYQRPQYDAVRQRGMIPLIDWASWDLSQKEMLNMPDFSLAAIINGKHDQYIHLWAIQAREWGHPFFLRFNWEMNGDWYPWSERVNGNRAGEFVQTWRHVHDIFTKVGATNVTWVWCPVTLYPEGQSLASLYPGSDYVDWTCMDGYNWGLNPARPDRWKSFSDVFFSTYIQLLKLAADKPIMIAEVASTEYGGSKATWITDAFTQELPIIFPRIKAVVWFNWNDDDMDWVIESSPLGQAAFAEAIAAPYYATNAFSNLRTAPIPPLEDLGWSEHAANWLDRSLK